MGAFRALPIVPLGFLLSACPDAAVQQFDASAHFICPGQVVTLSWKVSGSGTMEARPPVEGLPNGPVDAQGTLTASPKRTTDFVLSVRRFLGNPTASTQTVHVEGSAASEPLSVSLADTSAGCGNGTVWATVHAQRFADDVKAAAVATHPGDRHAYVVQHQGITAPVRPGAPATAFAGTSTAGDWLLTADLLAGEVCGTPSLPPSLVVDLTTQCAAGRTHP